MEGLDRKRHDDHSGVPGDGGVLRHLSPDVLHGLSPVLPGLSRRPRCLEAPFHCEVDGDPDRSHTPGHAPVDSGVPRVLPALRLVDAP